MGETTYRASCHCGKFVYEVTFPEPVTKAYVCNCSICSKKSYIHASEPKDKPINIVKGSLDELSSYIFGDEYDHKFCGNCGSAVLIATLNPEKPRALNVRCFQGPVDVWKLEKIPFDGASLPPPYKAPAFTGIEPTGEPIGGGTPTIYHGSCHCGAVRLALRSQPLDDTLSRDKPGDRVIECDCSICQRNGYRWFYPSADQVSIEDPGNNLKKYFLGKIIIGKTFCGKCGVPIGCCLANLSDEELAKLPEYCRNEEAMEWRKRVAGMAPVNTRILHGIDLEKLPVHISKGYELIDPQYVNP